MKFVSADGRHESVFNADQSIETEPANIATYNYGTNWFTHTVLDAAPAVVFGNTPNDGTTFLERLSKAGSGLAGMLPQAPPKMSSTATCISMSLGLGPSCR